MDHSHVIFYCQYHFVHVLNHPTLLAQGVFRVLVENLHLTVERVYCLQLCLE